MAITTNAAIIEKGSQTTAISDASAISAGAFNAGTITQFTPADKVSLADFSLDITFASAPAVGGRVILYKRPMNIDGANHAPVPDANYRQTPIGSFVVDLVATQQFLPLEGVPVGSDQEFYIENDTNQATTGTTVLKVTPKTYNGKQA